MTTVYISGPMRGLPNLNWQAFAEAQNKLERLGYRVINPAEMDVQAGYAPKDDSMSHRVIMRDLKGVLDADMVALLPGWNRSVGAKAEVSVARWAGKEIKHLSRINKP